MNSSQHSGWSQDPCQLLSPHVYLASDKCASLLSKLANKTIENGSSSEVQGLVDVTMVDSNELLLNSSVFNLTGADYDSWPIDSDSELVGLIETMIKNNNFSLDNLSDEFHNAFDYKQNIRNAFIILMYVLIFLVSLLGNFMVCYIIVTNRKLHTFTNCFIANLSVSDLLMTLINLPFGVARLLLDQWPFGSFMCKCLPFIQATSV